MQEALEHDLIAEVNLSNVLAARAEANKFYLFTCMEVAHVMHISIDAVYALRRAGAPFPFGKTRPEWLLDFMRTAGGTASIKASKE